MKEKLIELMRVYYAATEEESLSTVTEQYVIASINKILGSQESEAAYRDMYAFFDEAINSFPITGIDTAELEKKYKQVTGKDHRWVAIKKQIAERGPNFQAGPVSQYTAQLYRSLEPSRDPSTDPSTDFSADDELATILDRYATRAEAVANNETLLMMAGSPDNLLDDLLAIVEAGQYSTELVNTDALDDALFDIEFKKLWNAPEPTTGEEIREYDKFKNFMLNEWKRSNRSTSDLDLWFSAAAPLIQEKYLTDEENAAIKEAEDAAFLRREEIGREWARQNNLPDVLLGSVIAEAQKVANTEAVAGGVISDERYEEILNEQLQNLRQTPTSELQAIAQATGEDPIGLAQSLRFEANAEINAQKQAEEKALREQLLSQENLDDEYAAFLRQRLDEGASVEEVRELAMNAERQKELQAQFQAELEQKEQERADAIARKESAVAKAFEMQEANKSQDISAEKAFVPVDEQGGPLGQAAPGAPIPVTQADPTQFGTTTYAAPINMPEVKFTFSDFLQQNIGAFTPQADIDRRNRQRRSARLPTLRMS